MSYIIVQYQNQEDLKVLLSLEQQLIDLTAKLFNKNITEIIVDYQKFETYSESRKILVRGETSINNSNLLSEWANLIKKVLQNKVKDFGIKAYCVDSYWCEEDK
jgi:hypothetical protein